MCEIGHGADHSRFAPPLTDQNRNKERVFPVDGFRVSHYLNRMPIKPLIILPDPVLRLVSRPVERIDRI